MNETKFKVGDRVRAIKECDGNKRIIGETGTVKSITSDSFVGVEFDNPINGWKICNGVKEDNGWYCLGDILEPIHDNNKIVITTDGKTTTAKMYDGKKLVNSAKAVCSPDDEFDFNIGASIALERLTGQIETIPEEEQYFTGKAVCVSNECFGRYFTVGKIYNIVNGEFSTDDNMNCGSHRHIESVEELNTRFRPGTAKFLEIVE